MISNEKVIMGFIGRNYHKYNDQIIEEKQIKIIS